MLEVRVRCAASDAGWMKNEKNKSGLRMRLTSATRAWPRSRTSEAAVIAPRSSVALILRSAPDKRIGERRWRMLAVCAASVSVRLLSDIGGADRAVKPWPKPRLEHH
jgi:hypothetical protein